MHCNVCATKSLELDEPSPFEEFSGNAGDGEGDGDGEGEGEGEILDSYDLCEECSRQVADNKERYAQMRGLKKKLGSLC